MRKNQKMISIRKRGSVLIFSLIVLSFLLIAGLSLASLSIVDQKTASSTDRSTIAFQAADSAAEVMLQKIYKRSYSTLGALCDDIEDCSCDDEAALTGPLENMVSRYRVTFYDNDQVRFTDDNCDNASWRTEVVFMKSEGIYGNTTRAIQLVLQP